MHPISLDLTGRRVVVVGAGAVATRRVCRLLADGAQVTVVAPEATEQIAALARAGRLRWTQGVYRPGDLTSPERAWLVHTATGQRQVDAEVAAEAEREHIWCVRADDARRSTAWTPAVAEGRPGTESEGVTVAVTGDRDPRRATAVRDAVQAGLDGGVLPVRRTRRTAGATGVGRVHLVGGGPGDPDLITVRGRALLAAADVVVADRLGPRDLLDTLAAYVEIVDVGKGPGNHPVPQEQINAVLVEHALAGRVVVRLKGGDPFVLGRGGEEALHCLEHGIPVEVVPGVTSAVSVPAAAGIPVTHRGITASFVVASAHAGSDAALDAARDAPRDATLVLLMGVNAVAATAAGLMAAGRSPETPVAFVESGWTPRQRTTVTTLEKAAWTAVHEQVRSPAVVVVGEVVALRATLGDLAAALPG